MKLLAQSTRLCNFLKTPSRQVSRLKQHVFLRPLLHTFRTLGTSFCLRLTNNLKDVTKASSDLEFYYLQGTGHYEIGFKKIEFSREMGEPHSLVQDVFKKFNLSLASATFLYPLKTSENLTICSTGKNWVHWEHGERHFSSQPQAVTSLHYR